MRNDSPLHLFEGYGVELEYMLVNKESLQVMPIADQLIYRLAGDYVNEVSLGKVALSNELALHVVELKSNGPSQNLPSLIPYFNEQILAVNKILSEWGAQLLPTGSHPLMDPLTEMKLWPHGHDPVYEVFNKIFDCRGHGWANMQSVHLNLPFANDDEFHRLHAAIRLILPILPALCASSPMIEGRLTGFNDTRLDYYRKNQLSIPSITGCVIPESVSSKAEYETTILNKMYADIAQHDPEKILQREWLNSRGAIARFDRNAIEIRLLDIQEASTLDIHLLEAIVCLLQAMIAQRWSTLDEQDAWNETDLAAILSDVVKHGLAAKISNRDYLRLFGYKDSHFATAKALWMHIAAQLSRFTSDSNANWNKTVKRILNEGNLSDRITKALGHDFTNTEVKQVYRHLGKSLHEGTFFSP